jgi:hypothetical protein
VSALAEWVPLHHLKLSLQSRYRRNNQGIRKRIFVELLKLSVRLKAIKGQLALILAGILLGLAIAECGLRLLGIGQQGFYQWDADRGWALRPGAMGWQHREGNALVQINRDGMRDRSHSYDKPDDTIRIAFVGDSFTEAEQVASEDDFVSVVERRLTSCTRLRGMKVEALNFGCDSYGTAQELVTLRRHVWKFSPDIVVLVFFAGNDLRNNSLDIEWHLCQPFYLLQGDQLVPGGPFINSSLFRAECAIKFESRRSAVLNVLGDAVAQIRSVAKAKNVLILSSVPMAAAASVEPGLGDAIYKAPLNQTWQDAWKVTEKLIATMNGDVRGYGAQFLVVTASVGPQVYPDRAWRARYEKNLGVTDLFYPDFRIRELGKRVGFPVLNLAPALQSYADKHHVFLHGFGNTKLGIGHWNEAGHHLAGELIAGRLCDLVHDPALGNRKMDP